MPIARLHPRSAGEGFPGSEAPRAGVRPHDRLPLGALLFVVAFAAWYPLEPWWQSDDFIAVAYSADLGRALSDFAGNQYGLEGVTWFYRPLVTLSFWLEQAIAGGPSPLLSHLTNTIAHAISACLIGAIATRVLGPLRGWLTGVVWALAPTHAAAVFWAVGRVDSHTMVWMALACLLHVHWLEGRRRSRVPSLLVLALALCSKEHAVVVPGALALLGAALAPAGARWRSALTAWPAAVLVALYLGFRWVLFGQIGGYDATRFATPLESVEGLGRSLAVLVNPLWQFGSSIAAPPAAVRWLGFLPITLAILWSLHRRRWRLLLGCGAAFVALAVPLAPFLTHPTTIANLRYFYVPFVAIALVLAAGGVLPVVLALAVFALPMVEQHRDWFATYRGAAAMHRGLIEDAKLLPGTRLFVAGLPRTDPDTGVIAFHLGVDRLLQPPFVDADAARTVLALRPLDARPDALRVPYGDERGLPFAAPTLAFTGPTIRSLLPPAELPDCEVELVGAERIATADLMDLHEERRVVRLVVRGVRAPRFRVTIFTAGGYLTAILPDRGTEGSPDGAIDVAELLRARYVANAGSDRAHVAFALAVPTTLDLEPAFPVLVEALQDGVPTCANREPLVLRFDRGLARFLR